MAVERQFICNVNDVPENEGKSFTIDGISVALFKVANEFYALEDRCSHVNVPISGGYVHQREKCVACPWHGAQFDLKTGKVVTPPACEDIKSFEVSIEEDKVLIVL